MALKSVPLDHSQQLCRGSETSTEQTGQVQSHRVSLGQHRPPLEVRQQHLHHPRLPLGPAEVDTLPAFIHGNTVSELKIINCNEFDRERVVIRPLMK